MLAYTGIVYYVSCSVYRNDVLGGIRISCMDARKTLIKEKVLCKYMYGIIL